MAVGRVEREPNDGIHKKVLQQPSEYPLYLYIFGDPFQGSSAACCGGPFPTPLVDDLSHGRTVELIYTEWIRPVL